MTRRQPNAPETEVRILIARSSNADGGSISITIEDVDSLAGTVQVELDYETFAKVVTGMQCRAMATWHNVDKVGMVREHRTVTFEVPADLAYQGRNREERVREMYEQSYREEGWESPVYLGSQGSFFRKDKGPMFVTFSEYRWVPKKGVADGAK